MSSINNEFILQRYLNTKRLVNICNWNSTNCQLGVIERWTSYSFKRAFCESHCHVLSWHHVNRKPLPKPKSFLSDSPQNLHYLQSWMSCSMNPSVQKIAFHKTPTRPPTINLHRKSWNPLLRTRSHWESFPLQRSLAVVLPLSKMGPYQL